MKRALIASIAFVGIAAFFLWKEHEAHVLGALPSSAQRESRLVTTGPYAFVRHPQYVGFVAIMAGFLVQWPTLLTLLMFPVLVVMYVKLARREEREARGRFGEAWDAYAGRTPLRSLQFVTAWE